MLRVAKIRKVKEAEAIFPSGQDIYYDAWVITENDNHNVPRQDQDDQPLTSEGPYPPLRPILIGSTVLGLTPLSNVFSSNGNGPTFAWVSLPMVYTLTFSCLLILASCFNIINLIRVASRTQDVRVVVLAMGTPMYFFTSTVAMTFYVRFSSQLSHLLQIWNQTTRSLTKYLPTGNPFLSPMTQPRIHLSVGSAAKYTVLVFVLPALLELTLHDISMYMSKSCENATNFIDCVIQGKGVRQDIVLLQFFGRETLVAVFRIVTTLQANISWNFSDLLITVICLALNANFRVITDYLETTYEMAIQNNVAMDVDWNALRNDHLKMCQLVKKIDTVIAPMVLQSYAFNIYGLCYQVYYGIRPQYRSSISALYALISFIHLTCRIVAVSFAAGQLYNQIKAPLRILHRCPAQSFNNEAFRFLTQMYGSEVGVTGSRFFVVNQKILLGIASLIFTYELILLD